MFIADFHIHSKYSRATSKDCVPETLEMWARRKGIHVVGTGDFTHPAWREELKEKLTPSGEGLYTLKDDFRKGDRVAGVDFKPQFIVSGEVSSIYKKNGRVRKVHNLILLPDLEHAETISHRLEAIGNLHSDGRPILGLDSRDLLEIVIDICPEAIFIPAHIWTPHFSLYGAYSGFDDIVECFEDLTGYIHALETGLSSDPPMNWRLSALDRFTLVSNSDAHSPANLGREANIFSTGLSYASILKALKNIGSKEFYGTIEFFPEEGKYHYDGHRACKVCLKPSETKAAGGVCPVCGGRITVGVLHRVEALADREEGFVPPSAKHFESLIPLNEVIASSMGYTTASVKVKEKYDYLIRSLGPELFILREAPLNDIELAAGPCIAEGIRRLRCGKVEIQPGYDGEYGKIKIMDKSEIDMLSGQLSFIKDRGHTADSPVFLAAECPLLISDRGHTADSPVFLAAECPLLISDRGHSSEDKKAPALPDACPPDSSRGTAWTLPQEIPYGLNPEQWEAVSSSSPAVAVIAGPGTGKTKTLVSRIAYLVEKCGVHPSQITAVTFTNKAAKEMRMRLEKHFGDKRTAASMTIGTFHSICLQILSQWKGRDNITVIDEYDALSIMEEILKYMGLKISPRDAVREISLVKSGALAVDEKKTVLPADVYDLYRSQLERCSAVDYDDILLEVLKRYEGRDAADMPDSAPENPFSYLLVDEFQDINGIQYRLIKEWGRKSRSIFIIGDPDQSIYGFRGSDFRYFERFKGDFPDIREVRLTQNYRSTPEIIACAKSVISKERTGGLTPSLEAKRESGAKVRIIQANDEFSEAIFIAKEINRMVGGMDMLDAHALSKPKGKGFASGHPRGFSDIAVLYRTNRQAEVLEQCLQKEGIQYVVVGREEFLSEGPVREAIAFFKFLLNPGDIASLLTFLRAESAYPADLSQRILKSYAVAEKSASSLANIIEKTQTEPHIPDKPLGLAERLRKYESAINREKPWKILEGWINDNSLSGIRAMELLLNTSVMYEDLHSFIQNLVLGREGDVIRSGSKVYSPDAVSLMTIHGAKGLEFPIVFVFGVNDGMMPLRSGSHPSNIDEERRLFYVAMTRAQDELVLLTSRIPSPFIADIPEERLVLEKAFVPKQTLRGKQVSLFDL